MHAIDNNLQGIAAVNRGEAIHENTQYTDMALLVQLVVGEFQFVEIDDNGGPVGAQGWGIWVDVQPSWSTLLLKAADPASIVFVAVLVHWGHVHQQDVRDVRL